MQLQRRALVRALESVRLLFVPITRLAWYGLRVRSADARSYGHARADQRRRHQPAIARADVCADARAELRRPDG